MSTYIAKQAQSKPVALFASDVHLQASLPQTTQAFLDFLHGRARQAARLFLLGDLFEYWAGDDDDTTYNRQIVATLREVSDSGVKIFWIAGNRDFLVGSDFAAAAGVEILSDPTVVTLAGRRLILAHGDAQCTDDGDYMAFRARVRETSWQTAFLAMPLAQRKSVIEGLRNDSREAQRTKSYDIMDVNPEAVASLFDATGAFVMIHGHTHRPARHETTSNGTTRVRYVLPDWDCDAVPVRGGWLELLDDGTFNSVDVRGTGQ